jgi:hypothetical protein
VPTNRITGILNGQRAVTGDSALRLGTKNAKSGGQTTFSAEVGPNSEKQRSEPFAEGRKGPTRFDGPEIGIP